MSQFLKDKAYIYLFILFLASITPLILRLFHAPKDATVHYELYKPELNRLNSLNKLNSYIDSLYDNLNLKTFDTIAYVSTVSKVTKERFYHGTLDYSFSENWLAYLSSKLFWSHLSSIVIADDILKHSKGLCSQQTIVFMEILAKKRIPVRSVGLGYKEGPGHFLCEVKYKEGWHLYDVSVEPVWSNITNDHLSMDYYLVKKDSLFSAYQSKMSKTLFYKLLEKNTYGKPNQMPARNMILFHRITFILIYISPVALLLASVRSYQKRKKLIPGIEKMQLKNY